MTHAAQELLALNDQILALQQVTPLAGMELPAGRTALVEQIEQVYRVIRPGDSADQPTDLIALVQSEKGDWPPEYYRLVDTGSRCRHLAEPLERVAHVAVGLESLRNQVAMALVYPLLVCLLATIVLVVICQLTVPELQKTYRALDVETGTRLVAMEHVRDWMPIWAIAAGLLAAGVWYTVTMRRARVRAARWPLDAMAQARRDLEWGETAALTGALLVQNVSGAEALARARALLEDRRESTPAARTDSTTRPLLQWVLDAPYDNLQRAALARAAANAYREMSARRMETIGRWLPVVFCVALGGVATLIVGWSLFGPFAQFLERISSIAAP